VLTSDPALLDHVLSSAAAAGVEAEVVPDAPALRTRWDATSAAVVGIDCVAELARTDPPRRSEVYLVGPEEQREELLRWSVTLGAAVAVLPQGAAGLTANLADAVSRRQSSGVVIGLIGGSGGVGVSTCAAALAVGAARRRLGVVLVDGDGWGGGLDLLLGAERVAGWRWPKLSGARGHLGDLSGQLPYVEGIHLLAASRGFPPPNGTGAEQLAAVLGSTTRSHDLTVLDLPRRDDEHVLRAVQHSDVLVLVVRGDVRGVAAAQQLQHRLRGAAEVGVLVRGRRSGAVRSEAVADALGCRLLGSVPDDPSVPVAAERGDLPGRSPRSPLGRICDAVLDEFVGTRSAS
jgi:secretion/DNA translocation related CpaE-like protein